MKVLIATGLYPPDIGGPATYTKFLERHLPKHGIGLVTVAFTHVRGYPKIIRHMVYLGKLLWYGRDVDIIYALDTVSVGIPARVASFLMHKKMYLRVPGDYAWEQGQLRFGVTETLDEYRVSNKKPFPVRVLAWLQTRVAHSATRVIVPSEYMKRVVEMWGVRSERIVKIYSALNPISVQETKKHLRTRFGHTGFVVITAARLTPWKGIGVLIDVVIQLHDSMIPITLEIVGEGELRSQFEEQVRSNGAEGYIHIRGKESKQTLSERIKASDVFVLNTSYEGLSHQLLEAMDIGVPIVTTPAGGNTELITDGKTGIFVPFNGKEEIHKALETIRTNIRIREKLVEGAQKHVLNFTEDRIIDELLKVLR